MWHALQYSRLSSLNYLPFPALCIPGYLKLNPSADLPKRTLLVIISQPPHPPDLSPSHRLSPNPSLKATLLQRNESFGKGFEVWGLTDSHCLGPDNTVYSQWAEVGQKVYLAVLRMFTLAVSTAELAASRLHAYMPAPSASNVCYIHPDRPSVLLHPPSTEFFLSPYHQTQTLSIQRAHSCASEWACMHAWARMHADYFCIK